MAGMRLNIKKIYVHVLEHNAEPSLLSAHGRTMVGIKNAENYKLRSQAHISSNPRAVYAIMVSKNYGRLEQYYTADRDLVIKFYQNYGLRTYRFSKFRAAA